MNLKEAVLALNERQQIPVMIEYLMLDGLTDTPADVAALKRWLEPLRVRLNLIPYNPIQEAPHLKSSSPQRIGAFADDLRSSGYETTIRYSLGADIAAACGQLVKMSSADGQPQTSLVKQLRGLGKIERSS